MVNAPILVIFFNRPDTLSKVFEQIKKVKPNKLYLFQDGARNQEDTDKILRCRNIVSEIDWNCEVHTNYNEVNLGCGQGPFQAISWVLGIEGQAIILEDDCVADESFFGYCDELLERYKNDERVGMITGLNHFGTWECGDSSYFFGKTGANCGWATWSRVWKQYDYYLSSLDNLYIAEKLKDVFPTRHISHYTIRRLLRTKEQLKESKKLSYWDLQFEACKYLNSWLSIIPRENLISNVGFGLDATHNAGKSKFNDIPVGHIDGIKHPHCIIQDVAYDKKYYRITCPNYFIMVINKIRSMVK